MWLQASGTYRNGRVHVGQEVNVHVEQGIEKDKVQGMVGIIVVQRPKNQAHNGTNDNECVHSKQELR